MSKTQRLPADMAGIRIPMQFFAEPPADDSGTGQNGDGESEPLTLEQVFSNFKPEDILGSDSMKQALDSYTQTAVKKAVEDAQVLWNQQKLDDLDEAKKLEKMSATEREAYNLKKEREEFDKERKAFEHSQLEVTVGSELQKRGLPAEFSKFLTGQNAEDSKAQIDAFEKAFNQAVSDAVNGKLRGNPPKDGSGTNGKKMTLSEAMAYKNAHPEVDINTLI